MYKMKEVCQMTGLTEKAIRLYMEQKLVEPEVEEGVHRKSYSFKEKDIERLKDVSALRNAGFSMAEIRQMLENPANISTIVEEKETILAAEISQKLAVQEALKHLTIQEHSNVAKLADAIEPRSTYAKETPKKRMSRKKKWVILLILLMIVLTWTYLTRSMVGVRAILFSFGLVFGVFAITAAVRYLLYSRLAKQMECHGIGKVTAIVTNEKIEEYLGEAERSAKKEVIAYLLFGLFGEGIWEGLRPDCWYPIIQYQTKENEIQIATFRHGGFKNSWKIGDEVEIAWKEGKERLVYAYDGQQLRKKALLYFLFGLLMFCGFGYSVSRLDSPAESSILGVHTFELPEDADRLAINCGHGRYYVLNEEEKEVLMRQFREAKISRGERYIQTGFGGNTIHFYRGEEVIERLHVSDFYYVTTKNAIRYRVTPVALELYGTLLDDTTYITGFLNAFIAKVIVRYGGEAVLESISDMEQMEGLKELLSDIKNFDRASDLGNRYQFFLSETGYQSYFKESELQLQEGILDVWIEEGKFINAELTVSHIDKEGKIEEYKENWQ